LSHVAASNLVAFRIISGMASRVVSLLLTISMPALAQPRSDDVVETEVPLFRLQGELLYQSTENYPLSIDYIVPLARLGGSRWRAFAGIGGIVQYPGEDLDEPSPFGLGVDLRVGLVHHGTAGSPRVMVRVAPMYMDSEFELDRHERGIGLRASIGFSWPTWLLGRIPDDWSAGERAFVGFWFALLPTTIEYVYQLAPGDGVREGHAIAIGYGF